MTRHLSTGRSICAVLFFIAILSPGILRAQEFGRVNDFENLGAAYNTFFQPGEATVQVQVLGSIGRTGMWEVGVSVDLGQLIALAGGPTATLYTESQGSSRSHSEGTVKLYRQTGGRRDLIYEASIDQMLMEPEHYPPLRDGDVLLLETITHQSARLTWRDGFTVLSTILTTAILIDRLSN